MRETYDIPSPGTLCVHGTDVGAEICSQCQDFATEIEMRESDTEVFWFTDPELHKSMQRDRLRRSGALASKQKRA